MLNIKQTSGWADSAKEVSYEIRNQLDELTIGEFEELSLIMNNHELNTIDKWSRVFNFLGIPIDVIDSFDSFTFMDIIKEFNFFNVHLNKPVDEISLNGITYKASLKDDQPLITVKEMKLIEDAIKSNPHRYLANMLAIIYKRDDVDKTITYDNAHIKFKADMIRKEITADIAMPYIEFLSKKLINDHDE